MKNYFIMYFKIKLLLKWAYFIFLLCLILFLSIKSYLYIEYFSLSKSIIFDNIILILLTFGCYIFGVLVYKLFFKELLIEDLSLEYFKIKDILFFKQLLINSMLILSIVVVNYNNIIDFIVCKTYEDIQYLIENEFKNKNSFKNSDILKELIIDGNNKYEVIKYIKQNNVEAKYYELKENYKTVTDNIYFEMLVLQKIKEKDEETSKYLDNILKDDFVSIKEYEDFKIFLKNKN